MKITRENVTSIGILGLLLILAMMGSVGEIKWAENIYTLASVVMFIIALVIVFIKHSKIDPSAELVSVDFLHVLFCVSAGWWWLCILWIGITVSIASCMIWTLPTLEEQNKSEDQE